MKTKYTFYNSIVNLIYYILTVLLGLLNRKVLINTMGIKYQGINGLFSNILSMLSIAELGIGMTIIYHLYRTLEENNIILTRALISFYRKCYNWIALIITFFGIALIPFLPLVIPEVISLPVNINIIYLCFLLDSVCSYLFTYKRSILIADQKNFIVIIFDIFYQVIMKSLQIVILYTTHNYIYYLVIMVVFRLIENILLNQLVLYKYPFLHKLKHCSLPHIIKADIIQKVQGSMFHKMGSFFVMGTDNILLSHFFGLTVVGIYSNYELIITVLKNISTQIVGASTASVGHMLLEKDTHKNNLVFQQLQLINGGIMNLCASGIYCVTTPLIQFVFGTEFILSDTILLFLTFKFYITGMRQVYSVFKEASGILYEDRYIPLLESLINIIMSLVFIYFFGLVGIFLGTIISSFLLFFYTYPILVYKPILNKSYISYYLQLLRLIIIMLLSVFISKFITSRIHSTHTLMQIIAFSLICSIVSNTLFYFLYVKRCNEWNQVKDKFILIIGRCFRKRFCSPK